MWWVRRRSLSRHQTKLLITQRNSNVTTMLQIIMSDKKDSGTGSGDDGDTGLIVEATKPKLKKPPMYKVLLHNDDYTPMEFVVQLLMKFFSLSRNQAEEIMIHVHTRGMGVCGVYPREIAETKVRLVTDYAMENQHPLQCSMDVV